MYYWIVISLFALGLIGLMYTGYYGYIKKDNPLTLDTLAEGTLVMSIPPKKNNYTVWVDFYLYVPDSVNQMMTQHSIYVGWVDILLMPGMEKEITIKYTDNMRHLLSDLISKYTVKRVNGIYGYVKVRSESKGEDRIYPIAAIKPLDKLLQYVNAEVVVTKEILLK